MLTQNPKDIAALLQKSKATIAEKTLKLRMTQNPAMLKRYQEQDIQKFYQDCGYHLDFLSRSLSYDSPAIFTDYLAWVRRLFEHLPVSQDSLMSFFHSFAGIVVQEVDPERKSGLKEYLDDAMLAFSQPVELSVTFLDEGSQYGPIAGHVLDLLLLGHKEQASKYILETVNAGTSIRDCYLKIIQPLQYEIGRLWHAGKISVGQEHYVTAASQMIMSQFYPAIMDHPSSGKRIVTACISGEQHELGLRMVSDLLELEGWDTMFLGANTPLSTIPETVLEWKAGLLAISVTLSTHLDKLEQLIQLCRIQTPATKIMVGGYPFNLDKHLWHKMGADGYADDAVSTIGVAGKLLAGA